MHSHPWRLSLPAEELRMAVVSCLAVLDISPQVPKVFVSLDDMVERDLHEARARPPPVPLGRAEAVANTYPSQRPKATLHHKGKGNRKHASGCKAPETFGEDQTKVLLDAHVWRQGNNVLARLQEVAVPVIVGLEDMMTNNTPTSLKKACNPLKAARCAVSVFTILPRPSITEVDERDTVG